MEHYIFLAKRTDQGIRGIKEVHKRFDAFVQLLKDKRGRLLTFYATLGRYDYVVAVDLPSDEAALEVAVAMRSKGNVTIETCRAFDYLEFSRAVEKV